MMWKIVEAPKLMCHNMKLTKNQMLRFYTIYSKINQIQEKKKGKKEEEKEIRSYIFTWNLLMCALRAYISKPF